MERWIYNLNKIERMGNSEIDPQKYIKADS